MMKVIWGVRVEIEGQDQRRPVRGPSAALFCFRRRLTEPNLASNYPRIWPCTEHLPLGLLRHIPLAPLDPLQQLLSRNRSRFAL